MQRISRRTFMWGVGVGAAGMVGAACTRGGTGAKLTASPRTVSSVVIGLPPPTVESNNSNRDTPPNDDWQLKPMYEYLIGSDPSTGRWIPMLAEGWKLEPDGRSLRFLLRKGVQFHNGFGEFTAQDVVLAFQDLTTPAGAVTEVANVLRDTVEKLEVVNDYEIVFRNRSTSWQFFEGIAYGSTGMAIKSKADWDSRGGVSPSLQEPPIAGTGPYQFKGRVPGQNVTFKAVPYKHWRKNPGFPQLEFRFIGENSTRLAALLSGEIGIAMNLPPNLTAQASTSGASVISSSIAGKRSSINFLGGYLADPDTADGISSGALLYPDSPVNDPLFRRAVNKAIDRDALNKAFFDGKGQPLTLMYWLPELPGFDPAWASSWQEQYGFDPAVARQLLSQAGYGPDNPATLTVLTASDFMPESVNVMTAVATMLEDVGIKAPIVSVDPAQQRSRRESFKFSSGLEYDATTSEEITGFASGGAPTEGRGRAIERPEIYRFYERVVQELDPTKQARLYRQLGEMVYPLFNHVPLLRTGLDVVVDPGVVSGWTFPGAMVSAAVTHVEYIQAT